MEPLHPAFPARFPNVAPFAAPAADAAAEAAALASRAEGKQAAGDLAGAAADLLAAEAKAVVAGPAALAERVRIATTEARLGLLRREWKLAHASAARAVALAREIGSPALLGPALALEGHVIGQIDVSRLDVAAAKLREAAAIAETLGDTQGLGFALEHLGAATLAGGDLAGAAVALARGAAHFRAHGQGAEALVAGVNLARAEAERGATAAARALAREAGAEAEREGRRFALGMARAVEGHAAARAGRPAEAASCLDEAVTLAEVIGNALLEAYAHVFRTEARLLVGDVEAARVEAAWAGDLVAKTGNAELAARMHGLKAELARQAGDAAKARREANIVMTDPNRIAAHMARRVLSALAAAAGDGKAAASHAAAARAIAAGWEAPWHEAQDAVIAARAALASGDMAAAGQAAREALALASDLHGPAAAAAGLVLRVVGADAEARQAIAAALPALRPTWLALPHAARPGFLAAHGLDELAADLSVSAGGALTIDAHAYAAALAGLAGARSEAALAAATLAAVIGLVGGTRGAVLRAVENELAPAEGEGIDPAIAHEALTQPVSLATALALPLATPDERLGVLYVERPATAPRLTEPDVALLGGLAAATAAAMARERLYRLGPP